jgi:hypothetical protein
MQPFEFSLGIEGSEMIQKAGPERPAHNESIRRPETIPGKLLESLARVSFVSGIDRKPALGLFQKGKPIGGLNHKKCQLFSGRYTLRDKKDSGTGGTSGTWDKVTRSGSAFCLAFRVPPLGAKVRRGGRRERREECRHF